MALSSLDEIRLPQKTWNQECFHADSTRIISYVIFPCFTVIFAIQGVLRSAGDTMDLLWLSLSSLLSLSAFPCIPAGRSYGLQTGRHLDDYACKQRPGCMVELAVLQRKPVAKNTDIKDAAAGNKIPKKGLV